MKRVLAGPALILFIFLALPKNSTAESNIKINEFVAHPSTGNKEWVEFYNPDSIDLTSYYLDDDTNFNSDGGSSNKKSLGGINTQNPNYPYLEFDSFLNNGGDYVVLFTADGTLLDQYQYEDDPGGDVTLGRSPDGLGDFVTLSEQTKGSANPTPLPSPTPTPSPIDEPSPTPTTQTSQSNTQSSSTTNSNKSSSSPPKPTPTPLVKSPSPKALNTSTVLAARDEPLSPSTNQELSASPSPKIEGAKSTSNLKFALALIGSGSTLIGLALILYLWYSKKLADKEKEQSEFVQN